MTVVAVIPARYASTRFPAKPLANQTGKYLIQHVYERVQSCERIEQVIVATDDDRIVSAVESFGGIVRLTRKDHPSGTDRVAEVADALDLRDSDLVINVQGDEPEIDPKVLDKLVASMLAEGDTCSIGTLAAHFQKEAPCSGPGSPTDPNCVKVVVDDRSRAIYFSRSLIPYPRATNGTIHDPSRWLLHLGVYAFRVGALAGLVRQGDGSQCELETCESLEQLRWLSAGQTIRVVMADHPFVGIDTPEEYRAFVERVRSGCSAEVGT